MLAQPSRYDFGQLRVLIVDDEPNMRRLIATLLGAMNCKNVDVASNGEMGFEIFQNSTPDIVITDWQMEPLDGLDLARRIRDPDNSRNAFVPIMMLSGHAEAWRVKKARDIGINVFVAKPVSTKTLATQMIRLIEDPRPFVKTSTYFGPDRRWRDDGPPKAGERRFRTGGVRW